MTSPNETPTVARTGILYRPWFWPALIISFLTVHAVLWIGVAIVASSDPSFAVEPGYYDKAVHWDDETAQRTRNAELGWTLEWQLGPADVVGKRELALILKNVDATPLDGAEVTVEAFHHARGDARTSLTLAPAGAGRYAVTMQSPRAGLWELRTQIRRGPQRFTSVDHLFVKRTK